MRIVQQTGQKLTSFKQQVYRGYLPSILLIILCISFILLGKSASGNTSFSNQFLQLKTSDRSHYALKGITAAPWQFFEASELPLHTQAERHTYVGTYINLRYIIGASVWKINQQVDMSIPFNTPVRRSWNKAYLLELEE